MKRAPANLIGKCSQGLLRNVGIAETTKRYQSPGSNLAGILADNHRLPLPGMDGQQHMRVKANAHVTHRSKQIVSFSCAEAFG